MSNLVEGEKCAQALIDKGFCYHIDGWCKYTLNKTDWSALQGKEMVIWPDNDDVGKGLWRKSCRVFENQSLLNQYLC